MTYDNQRVHLPDGSTAHAYTRARMQTIGGWRLRWYFIRASKRWAAVPNVRGRRGWSLTVGLPTGGTMMIPRRTRLRCLYALLRNRQGWAWRVLA